jgi:hypothetical protein
LVALTLIILLFSKTLKISKINKNLLERICEGKYGILKNILLQNISKVK